jgi:exosortase A
MSAIPNELRLASPWRTALPVLVALLAAIGLLYRHTALAMVEIWERNNTFAHAWLVLPISLWLVWRQRERLSRLTPQPMPGLLLLLLLAAAAWLLADLVAVNVVAQFAFVGMLILAVSAVLGRQVAQSILFPLLFLLFAVPFGEFMVQPMMDWTADFVVLALQSTGIPVYREGLFFVIPSGNWSVIDECSGVRYLIASFMVGTLFAYLNYRSYKRRAIFMAVAIATPIVANWLRAYIIVMMGHFSDNKLATGVDHLLYGWVFFGIVIFIMFAIGMRWSEPEDAMPAGNTAAERFRSLPFDGRPLLMTALAAGAIALLPHLAVWGLQSAERTSAEVRIDLPPVLAPDRRLGDPPALDWKPVWQNPSAEVHRAYAGADGTVGVYVAYYRGQNANRKLVASTNAVVGINDRQWNPVGAGHEEVVVDGRAVRFGSTEILGPQSPGAGARPHVVAWRVYWVDGRFVTGDAQTKLANAWSRLQGRGDDGAVIVLYADREGFAASRAALESFAGAHLVQIGAALQRTRDTR